MFKYVVLSAMLILKASLGLTAFQWFEFFLYAIGGRSVF